MDDLSPDLVESPVGFRLVVSSRAPLRVRAFPSDIELLPLACVERDDLSADGTVSFPCVSNLRFH